jgi:uncharacterized protein YggT (Ycf19 family)
MEPRELTEDEARRLKQHEEIKREVRGEVHDEIRHQADRAQPLEEAHLQGVARELKSRAIAELTSTEAELARARTAARAAQVIDYLFSIAYGLIVLLFLLNLVGARATSGFMRFLVALTAPLLSPFRGLMWDPHAGSFELRLSYLVALLVYALLHMAVRGAFRLFVRTKTTV